MIFDRVEPGWGGEAMDYSHGAEIEEFLGDGWFLGSDEDLEW